LFRYSEFIASRGNNTKRDGKADMTGAMGLEIMDNRSGRGCCYVVKLFEILENGSVRGHCKLAVGSDTEQQKPLLHSFSSHEDNEEPLKSCVISRMMTGE
jgi:hypothetical protein